MAVAAVAAADGARLWRQHGGAVCTAVASSACGASGRACGCPEIPWRAVSQDSWQPGRLEGNGRQGEVHIFRRQQRHWQWLLRRGHCAVLRWHSRAFAAVGRRVGGVPCCLSCCPRPCSCPCCCPGGCACWLVPLPLLRNAISRQPTPSCTVRPSATPRFAWATANRCLHAHGMARRLVRCWHAASKSKACSVRVKGKKGTQVAKSLRACLLVCWGALHMQYTDSALGIGEARSPRELWCGNGTWAPGRGPGDCPRLHPR